MNKLTLFFRYLYISAIDLIVYIFIFIGFEYIAYHFDEQSWMFIISILLGLILATIYYCCINIKFHSFGYYFFGYDLITDSKRGVKIFFSFFIELVIIIGYLFFLEAKKPVFFIYLFSVLMIIEYISVFIPKIETKMSFFIFNIKMEKRITKKRIRF